MTELVVTDIGGTHARFAIASIASDGKISLGDTVTLQTREHPNLATAWEAFARLAGRELPKAASLALAAPIVGDYIRLTNNPWSFRRSQLSGSLGIERHSMINDFGAIAHAVAHAPKDQFIHVSGPEEDLPEVGAITIIGPGTGLGVALLLRFGDKKYHVQSSEGGHADFAPVDTIDDALVAHLRPIHGRVCAERIVSGPAIAGIYHTLAKLEGRAVPEHDDRTIWRLGMSGEDSLAAAAVERFCLSLGSVAGDFALGHGSQAVVIAGGVGQRVRDTLANSGFAERFNAKDPYERLMAGIPVKLITHPQPGLYGAAAAFAAEHIA